MSSSCRRTSVVTTNRRRVALVPYESHIQTVAFVQQSEETMSWNVAGAIFWLVTTLYTPKCGDTADVCIIPTF